MKLFKRKDFVIVAIIVLLIAASASPLLLRGDGGARVNIYVGGDLYDSFKAGAERTVTIDRGDGQVNVVRLTKTGVRMESSTCPHQDCVMQGELPFEGKAGSGLLSNWIICLPNGVSVEITADE